MPDEIEVTVVRNGGKDVMVVPSRTEELIANMLHDRAGYIAGGHLHLIPDLDATLRYHGYEGELPAYQTETKTKTTRSQ